MLTFSKPKHLSWYKLDDHGCLIIKSQETNKEIQCFYERVRTVQLALFKFWLKQHGNCITPLTVKYVIAALALSELVEADTENRQAKKRGGLFKGKGKGKAKGPKGQGKRPKGGKRGTRTRPLQPSSSIQVQASQARSIFADEAEAKELLVENNENDIEIVNYDDEPDYTKEYPEYESDPQTANDFIAAVAADEAEEPEEPVEEAAEPQPDVQRSGKKLPRTES